MYDVCQSNSTNNCEPLLCFWCHPEDILNCSLAVNSSQILGLCISGVIERPMIFHEGFDFALAVGFPCSTYPQANMEILWVAFMWYCDVLCAVRYFPNHSSVLSNDFSTGR